MNGKIVFISFISFFPFLSFSQKIEKTIDVKKEFNDKNSIYSNIANDRIVSIINTHRYLSKVYVVYENKFYSVDTLKQIKNLSDYKMDIIEFPDKITKDIEKLVILKKAIR